MQDVGWFFEAYNSFRGYTMERRDTDIQMRTKEEYNDPNRIKTIATSVVYISNKINEIQINFQKIQNVFANIGGVLGIFKVMFTILCLFVLRNFM